MDREFQPSARVDFGARRICTGDCSRPGHNHFIQELPRGVSGHGDICSGGNYLGSPGFVERGLIKCEAQADGILNSYANSTPRQTHAAGPFHALREWTGR